jgi:hypothetical protein
VLDSPRVWKVRWDKCGSEPAGDYTFSSRKWNAKLTHWHAVRAEGSGATNDNRYYEEQTVYFIKS